MTLQWQSRCCLTLPLADLIQAALGSTCEQRLHRTALEGVWHSQALTARPSATTCVCSSGMTASCCMQGGRGSGTAGIRCSLQTQGGSSMWDGCRVWECSCSPCRSVAAIAESGASWSWQSASLFTAMHNSSLCAIHQWSTWHFCCFEVLSTASCCSACHLTVATQAGETLCHW